MLRHTFCHLPGVGARTEQRLWDSGLTTWDAVDDPRLAARARRLCPDLLRESAARYAAADPAWFGERLGPQSWRLFGDFRSSTAYLDIETTGMGSGDVVTTIALYDGRVVRTYVRDRNLHDVVRDIAAYRLLVTFNGKCFDVPVLERCLRCRLPQAHVDLRHVLAGLGLRGGLKSCERQLGLSRPGLEDVDGAVAVLLWWEYKRRGDPRVLETLLAYNVQDVLNLETLMVLAHNRKLAELAAVPFTATYRLPAATPVENPFRPDPDLVWRLVRMMG
jgi:hypothetical protein